jgi:hypothetical protein
MVKQWLFSSVEIGPLFGRDHDPIRDDQNRLDSRVSVQRPGLLDWEVWVC